MYIQSKFDRWGIESSCKYLGLNGTQLMILGKIEDTIKNWPGWRTATIEEKKYYGIPHKVLIEGLCLYSDNYFLTIASKDILEIAYESKLLKLREDIDVLQRKGTIFIEEGNTTHNVLFIRLNNHVITVMKKYSLTDEDKSLLMTSIDIAPYETEECYSVKKEIQRRKQEKALLEKQGTPLEHLTLTGNMRLN